jgi:hypothetical protein
MTTNIKMGKHSIIPKSWINKSASLDDNNLLNLFQQSPLSK